MEQAYFSAFLNRTGFPPEAQAFLLNLYQDHADDLQALAAAYLIHPDADTHQPAIDALASATGYHSYSLWLCVLILASEQAQSLFSKESIFWDTFTDLRYKALECHAVYGIWGTFVAFWYGRFFRGNLVKLGRLEYETRPFPLPESHSLMGITLRPSDPVRFIHIPSSAEPFTAQARLDSYRRAWEYFGDHPLICLCSSWLLYPPYRELFPKNANCWDFSREFVLVQVTDTPDFSDGWRIFGRAWETDQSRLPEDTAMRRSFKEHLLRGGATGTATGLLIFDGKNILTKQ